MHRCDGIRVGHITLLHLGIDDPVVGSFEPLLNPAAQISQCITEHRAALDLVLKNIHPCKPIGPGREALEEMAHQLLVVVVAQDVEHKAVTDLQERFGSQRRARDAAEAEVGRQRQALQQAEWNLERLKKPLKTQAGTPKRKNSKTAPAF